SLTLRFQYQRSGLSDRPLRGSDSQIAVKEFRLIRRIEESSFSFQLTGNLPHNRRIRNGDALRLGFVNDPFKSGGSLLNRLDNEAISTDGFQRLPKEFDYCCTTIIFC